MIDKCEGVKPMKIRLTEEIRKEGNMYVSYCPELDIASCGEDVQQAKKNLKDFFQRNHSCVFVLDKLSRTV